MNRIEKIREKRQQLDEAARREADDRNCKINKMIEAVKSLAPRISELMEVAQEMINQGINFPTYGNGSFVYEHFVTDGVNHKLGFVFNGSRRDRTAVKGIGIRGGGCDGHSLMVDKNGLITVNPLDEGIEYPWMREHADWVFFDKTKRFLEAFDKFESDFYDFIDNL
jgi:hypothetical protein